MKKFIIKTLGCKTNQVESALIAEILTSNNYIETNSIEDANYYILNSCSVTHIADTKNLSYLRRARRENPNLKIVVTGCMAQLEKENLLKDNIADFVIGNNEKADIVKIGLELDVPYELTWSCYEGKDRPCGTCGTCIDRAKAFAQNGVKDPALV